ncbi:MAG TPA: transglutaminaseTgpA domain-containing protein [Trebonia sp.]|nr:transglutaminaseTgpA domain-containing protein [Trebonia sp.]
MTSRRANVQLGAAAAVLAGAGVAAGYPELVLLGAASAVAAVAIRPAAPPPSPRPPRPGRDRARWQGLPRGADVVFRSLRYYQPGDRLSLIDWRATARRGGSPVVREFGDPREPDEALVPEGAGNPGPVARPATQVALIATALALTAVLYGGFFAGWGFLPRLAAVAAGACALATVVAWARLAPAAATLAGAIGLAVAAELAVLSGGLDPGAGWDALTGGWAAMLTVAAPAPDSPPMLMFPVIVTWVAGYASVAVALRARSVLGPAAIVTGAQVTGLAFAANQPATHLLQAGALAVLLLALTLIRAGRAARRGHHPLARALAPGIALVAAATAIGLLTAVASRPADAAQRFTPRQLLAAPLRLPSARSPLSSVRDQVRKPDPATLFTIAITGTTDPPPLIAAVALDSFDGTQWSSSDSYRVSGPVLAPGPPVAGGMPLTERVTVRALAGPYLPADGWPARIDAPLRPGILVGFDPGSGILVADAASLAGVRYTVTTTAPPAHAPLADAAAGSGPAVAPYLRLPGKPGWLTALARKMTRGQRSPDARLQAIQRSLRALPVTPDAAPGVSYGRLRQLLQPATAQEGAGYADQHAAAFTLLARAEGIPARVIMGYRLPSPSSVRGDTRTYPVTTADAYAWAQAYFPGHGWVDFDPTDTGNVASAAATAPGAPSVRPSAQPQPSPGHASTPAPVPTAPPTTVASPPSAPAPTAGHGPGPATAGLPAALAVAALAVLGVLAVAGPTAFIRRRRRRRRHQGSPAQRLAGAWGEMLDRLADTGVVTGGSQTVRELADQAASAVAARQAPGARLSRPERALERAEPYLTGLATAVAGAAFGDVDPGEEAARQAWEDERELTKALYRRWRAVHGARHWGIPVPRRRRR